MVFSTTTKAGNTDHSGLLFNMKVKHTSNLCLKISDQNLQLNPCRHFYLFLFYWRSQYGPFISQLWNALFPNLTDLMYQFLFCVFIQTHQAASGRTMHSEVLEPDNRILWASFPPSFKSISSKALCAQNDQNR